MSKFLISVCRRQKAPSTEVPHPEAVFSRLLPDHISHLRPHVTNGENGVILTRYGGGVAAKHCTPQLGIPCPRPVVLEDDGSVEICSDMVGANSIWYACTGDLFVASTSQRAIVSALGAFQLNGQAVLWMLSSGCLGPGHTWDKQIQCLPANARLRLDRRAWQVNVEERDAVFRPCSRSDSQHGAVLREAIAETFREFCFDASEWTMPLSGGVDSRAILLLLLENGQRVPCITWGTASSTNQRGSDAFVARRVARHYDLEHRFFELDSTDEPFDRIVHRFLVAGEGRVDHIGGYMDGFRLWHRLCESGVRGIIRGDEGFGWERVRSHAEVFQSVGLTTFEGFSGLPAIHELGLDRFGEQNIPTRLQRLDGESLATWRDRLYHTFRIPCILAALNDLKAPYVEIVSPLLSPRIITAVRTLPDYLRTDKRLFKQIVRGMGPRIPYAKRSATMLLSNILESPTARRVIFDELNSPEARHLLGEKFREHLLKGTSPVGSELGFNVRSIMGRAKRLVPRRARSFLRRRLPPRTIPHSRLALRAYLVCKMIRLLEEDARLGRESLILS